MGRLANSPAVLLVLLVSLVALPAAALAQESATGRAAGKVATALPHWQESLTGMVFVKLPKGCFQMGNRRPVAYLESYPGHPLTFGKFQFVDELPQHEVCVDAFWVGKYEVRADEWQRVMGGGAPRADLPATGMSWHEAQRFAEKLGQLGGGKERFRLPSEAEWEYACRAGARQDVEASFGKLLSQAWYLSAYEKEGEVQAVGQLQANAFGLHDTLGNVWEWVQDSYQRKAYQHHALFNPQVRVPSAERVIRGASYRSEPLQVRCAKRGSYAAKESLETIGLRLVRVP